MPVRPFPLLFALLLASCYLVRPNHGGGKASAPEARRVDPSDIALPRGYRIEAVATGLNFPTGVAVDDSGSVYVTEAGYVYGEVWDVPRLVRVGRNNVFTAVAVGDSNGPWTGLAVRSTPQGRVFYVAEGGVTRGGRILKVTEDGKQEALVEGLPSLGDHHTNGPALGRDGLVYFSQGTATNSGIVGEDNYGFGWLARHKEFHDIPCRDVTLAGQNFLSEDPFKKRKRKDTVETGAFSPFGVKTLPGQVIPGQVPCNGALMRVSPQGGKPELIAWGFRNPFGLAFSPAGELFITDNGYDDRGSRPVWGAGESLWKVRADAWYGWPDFSGDRPLDRSEFRPPHRNPAPALLDKDPGEVPRPVAVLPVHSSADGLDFSVSPDFGFEGQAFVAEFGDMAPTVGKVLEPVGFKVVRVDVNRGVTEDFAVNRESPNGPASLHGDGGLERPIAVRFSPAGNSLYIVDFGAVTVSGKGARPLRRSGVLWRVWKEKEAAP